jgi:hypothetical protein
MAAFERNIKGRTGWRFGDVPIATAIDETPKSAFAMFCLAAMNACFGRTPSLLADLVRPLSRPFPPFGQ